MVEKFYDALTICGILVVLGCIAGLFYVMQEHKAREPVYINKGPQDPRETEYR